MVGLVGWEAESYIEISSGSGSLEKVFGSTTMGRTGRKQDGQRENSQWKPTSLLGISQIPLGHPQLSLGHPSFRTWIYKGGTQMKISSASSNLRYSQIPFSVIPTLFSIQVPKFQCSCDICLTSSKNLSVKLRGGVEITDQFKFPKEACDSPGSRK